MEGYIYRMLQCEGKRVWKGEGVDDFDFSDAYGFIDV